MTKQSDKLRSIASFLDTHDLNNVITVKSSKDSLSFEIPYWDTCDAETRRHVKRIFGPLEVRSGESWRYMTGNCEIDDENVELDIHGAFDCRIASTTELAVALTHDDRARRLKQIADLQAELESDSRTEVKRTYDCKQRDPREEF